MSGQSQSPSSSQVQERFLKPFHKITIGQLNKAWKKEGAWRQYFGKTEVELGMVWLQGVVENLDKDSDWLEISEEHNRVKVLGVSSSPGGDNWLQVGQYIQVIGQLKGEESDPHVLCMNVRDLTLSRVAKDLWPLEVAELQGLLAGRLSIQSYESMSQGF